MVPRIQRITNGKKAFHIRQRKQGQGSGGGGRPPDAKQGSSSPDSRGPHGWRLYASSLAALQLALHGLCTPCAHAGSKKNDVKITIDDDFQNLLKQSVDAIGSMGISGLMGFCIAKALKFVGGIVAVLVGLGLIGYKALELLDYDVKQYSSLLKEHVTYLLHRKLNLSRLTFDFEGTPSLAGFVLGLILGFK